MVSDRRLLNLVRRYPPEIVIQRVGEVVKALGGAKFKQAHGELGSAAGPVVTPDPPPPNS